MAGARQRLRDRGGGQFPSSSPPPRIRAICAAHTGVAADGILLLSEPEHDGYVARLRIFNPDGSEAELSGNGAREAVLYLRRHRWTDADTFAIETLSGDIRPGSSPIPSARSTWDRPACRAGLPFRRARRAGRTRRRRAQLALSARPGRKPPMRHPPQERSELDSLDLKTIGPGIEHHDLFPNRTNVSWFASLTVPLTTDPRPDLRARRRGDDRRAGPGRAGAASPTCSTAVAPRSLLSSTVAS